MGPPRARASRVWASRARLTAGAVLVTALVAAACGGSAPPASPAPALPDRLVAATSGDGALGHLRRLQEIADRSGGNRAAGTPGDAASVDFVAGALRAAGFVVDTPTVPVDSFSAGAQTLAVAGVPGPAVLALTYSPPTPPGGLVAPLVVAPVDPTPGCEATDYAGLPVRGAVVLVRRGSCTFTAKGLVAAQAGAAAMLVANTEDGPLQATFASPGEARVPSATLSRAGGDALATRSGSSVALVLSTRVETRSTRNVVAQTRSGRPDEVVLAGAHLDSVPAGPGIDDNGSGSAALLDTALALGPTPPVANAVRFAWWGAEELGLVGSTAYVRGLTPDGRRDIALALNADMVASPNPAYFVYDGDDSDRVGAGGGPPGSDAVERRLVARLAALGVPARGTDVDGRSDYGPFLEAGIPVGGVFTGAEGAMTPEEAALWGGRAGEPYDRCYHQPCDTLADLDLVALDRMTDVLAGTLASYAVDLGGPDGVPGRAARTVG